MAPNNLIFEHYFKDNTHLSNLYSWLDDPTDTNKLYVDNVTEYLNNITEADFHTGGTETALKNSLTTLSVLKKDHNAEYSLEEYDSGNPLHFLPALNNIGSHIQDGLKIDIQKTFIIYQYYDYLFDNPHIIYTFSKDHNPTKYYDIFTDSEVTPTDFVCPYSGLDHKDYLYNAKDVLNLELIFVCRNLMLALLYKHIYSAYLYYYNLCNDLGSGTCDATPTYSIDSLIANIDDAYQKWLQIIKDIAYNIFELNVTFNINNNRLEVGGGAQSTQSEKIFDIIIPTKHIMLNTTTGNFVTINHNITRDADGYDITQNAISPLPNNGDTFKILTKNNTHIATQYNNKLDQLTNSKNQLQNSKDTYNISIINHKQIKNSFTNVDVIYYVTLLIVAITLIAIFAAKSDNSFTTRVFILLIIVVLTYIILFGYLEVSKQFTENFTNAKDNANIKIDNVLNLIYSLAPQYGKTDLYNILNENVKKDLKDVINNHKMINTDTERNTSISNSEWHKLFQRTLFIHTTFLVLIIVLTYLWLSTSIPDISLYLFIITLIVCMVLIFNYFKSLHRIVRVSYRHKYWTKMDV